MNIDEIDARANAATFQCWAEAMREACASRLAVGAFALSPEDAAKVVLSTNIPEDS